MVHFNSVKRCHSGPQLPANNRLDDLETDRRFRLGCKTLAQNCDIARLWLAGNDLTCLAYPPECRRAAESEIAIVRTDIEYAVHAPEGLCKPFVQFVFVKSKHLPKGVSGVYHDSRTAEGAPPDMSQHWTI